MNPVARVVMGFCIAAAILLSGAVLMDCGDVSGKDASLSGSQSTAPQSTESTSSAVEVAESPLAGTEWRLMEFQSMNDTVGTTRPKDPSRYIMRLNSDGSVNMRLNCNTAKGTWSAEAGSDPSSGRFELRPLATTRALCPPPSMDEHLSSNAQYVRSYMLKDGRLYMSLMADGGIYVWEPLTEARFQTEPDAAIEAAILQVSPYYTKDVVDVEGSTGTGRYVYSRVDLNGDRKDEVFVYLIGSFFCGTGGCNLMLFTEGTAGYSLVNDFPISRLPVIVSAKKTEGWNDIIRLESGGGAPPTYVTHAFNGKHYVERDRILADTAPEGTRYLTGELTFDKGIPLEPQN